MMQEYAVHTGWMWVPAVVGILVLFLLMLMIGRTSKK
jgi:hypothetical protein